MRNKVQDGKVIPYTEPGSAAILSGAVVVVGHLIGIATGDIAQSGTGELAIEGVFSVPKNTSEALTQGDSVVLDISTGEFRASGFTTATGDIVDAGIVTKAAASADATVEVKINVGGATVA